MMRGLHFNILSCLNECRWTKEESAKLQKLVEKLGTNRRCDSDVHMCVTTHVYRLCENGKTLP